MRVAKKLTLRKFADLMGLSPTYVSMVENHLETRGYSQATTMRAIAVLSMSREDAAVALSPWRTFHQREVRAIDDFLLAIPESCSMYGGCGQVPVLAGPDDDLIECIDNDFLENQEGRADSPTVESPDLELSALIDRAQAMSGKLKRGPMYTAEGVRIID